MRLLAKILFIVSCAIALILSLAFIVIEGRLILSQDWVIYDNPINGLIRYLLRFIFALIGLTMSIFEFINLKKKNSFIGLCLVTANFSLLVMSIILMILGSNGVGTILLIISLMIIFTKLLLIEKNNQ